MEIEKLEGISLSDTHVLSESKVNPPSSSQKNYTKKKFKLNEDERKEFEDIFALITGDEKNISAKEMGTVMSKLGIHTSKEELNDMIDVVDKDGYSLINKKHFMRLMTQKVKETREENSESIYEDTFNTFDTGHKGKLSMADIRSIMLNIGEKVCDEEIVEMLKVAGVSKSGISYEGFMQLLQSQNF